MFPCYLPMGYHALHCPIGQVRCGDSDVTDGMKKRSSVQQGHIKSLVNELAKGKTLVTVDVFDTVLTRCVGKPTSAFLLLGRLLHNQGLVSCSPEEFAQARITTEIVARLASMTSEVTIDEIYQRVQDLILFSNTCTEELVDYELSVERRLARPIPIVLEMIQELRASGHQVAFVSDTYLPARYLTEVLNNLGIMHRDERLYASCEYGTSKSGGGLYPVVLSAEKQHPDSAVHIGNNAHADYASPRKIGLAVLMISQGNLNRYEELLEEGADASGGFTSILAGASRLTRLTVPANTPREEIIRDVAAGVAAPALVAYVLWILRRARLYGISDLYFVSRDGHIMLRIAQILADKGIAAPRLHYLHGGRQAWHLPAVFQVNSSTMGWITDLAEHNSLSGILARVGLAPADVSSLLPRYGLERGAGRGLLGERGAAKLRHLVADKDFISRVESVATVRRRLLVRYLESVGLTTARRPAVVDTGWSGRALGSLAAVLRSVGCPPPIGLYFSLGRARCGDDGVHREAYMFDLRGNAGIFGTGLRPPLTEMFTKAPHGPVIGFAEVDGAVKPMLNEKAADDLVKWGVPLLQHTISAFAASLCIDQDLVDAAVDVRPWVARSVAAFWESPERDEAEVWGEFPYEDDQASFAVGRVARCMSWRAMARASVGADFREAPWQWPAGSLMMSAPWQRAYWRAASAAATHMKALPRPKIKDRLSSLARI